MFQFLYPFAVSWAACLLLLIHEPRILKRFMAKRYLRLATKVLFSAQEYTFVLLIYKLFLLYRASSVLDEYPHLVHFYRVDQISILVYWSIFLRGCFSWSVVEEATIQYKKISSPRPPPFLQLINPFWTIGKMSMAKDIIYSTNLTLNVFTFSKAEKLPMLIYFPASIDFTTEKVSPLLITTELSPSSLYTISRQVWIPGSHSKFLVNVNV